jgi:GH24 family phage-related lysozyme (muramidase)
MTTAADLVVARVTDPDSPSYEGYRADCYDDATGKPVVTQGQPTVGYGSRVREWSQARAENDIRWYLGWLEGQIATAPWYRGTDIQKSVLLEVAFNQGLGGLLHYPHMLAYCAAGNFALAATECTIAQSHLRPRYDALAKLLKG